ADAAGFRIDTGYSNKDPLDKTQKQAGQGYRGYGILREKGMADAAGFRIDTGYSNKDPLDKTQKQAGQGYRGY
ncbi:hypothetical protein EDM27_17310, partial [Staphylococcus aureus]